MQEAAGQGGDVRVGLGTVGTAVELGLLPRIDDDCSVTVDGTGAALPAVTMFGLMFGLIEGSTDGWSRLAVAALVDGPAVLRRRQWPALRGLALHPAGAARLRGPRRARPAPADHRHHHRRLRRDGADQRLGRNLVAISTLLTLAGGGWLLALVLGDGTGLSLWSIASAVLVAGRGMGACFGTIFDIALGDIDPEKTGSAIGSLTAVQQLANGIGSAVVTSVYFRSGAPPTR